MALSKPSQMMFELLGAYFSKLYSSPVKTRCFTSCATATIGNIISQKMSRTKNLNADSLLAFAIFGLLFGGSLPYYFNNKIYRFLKHPMAILLVERLIFTPSFQAFYLYMLAIFEGKSHEESCEQMRQLYPPILTTNLRYLTLLQFINLKYVPPMLRIFSSNFIDLLWTIYVTHQRAKLNKCKCVKKCPKCN